MRLIKILALAGIMAASATGMAQAQFIGGGTPDAQNGAKGRDQPSSFQGHRHMYSGRSVGYGYGYGQRYGYERYAPHRYYAPY